MSYGYVYKTVNMANGKAYIGQRQGRFAESYLGSGVALKRAVQKYGRENFIVRLVRLAESRPGLDSAEIALIKSERERLGHGNLYNLADGGEGRRGPMPEAAKIKIRAAMIGRVVSDETRKKLSAAAMGNTHGLGSRHSGWKHTQEFKDRMSALKAGRPGKTHSAEARKKMSAAKLGKSHAPHSMETRAAIAASLRGRARSEEDREAMRNGWAARRRKNLGVLARYKY